MRRTASEVIRDLEQRIARLEKSALDDRDNDIDNPKVAHSWRRFQFKSNLQNYSKGGKIETIRDRMLKDFKDTVYIFRSENGYPPFLAERRIDRIFFLMFGHLSRLTDLFEKYDRELLITDIYVSKGKAERRVNLSFSLSIGPDFYPPMVQFINGEKVVRGEARHAFFDKLLLDGERQVISYNVFEGGISSSNPLLVANRRRTPKALDEALNYVTKMVQRYLDHIRK